MNTKSENLVKLAIERVGGPTKASHLCGVSNVTVHNWIRNERIPDMDRAETIAGKSGVAVAMLRRVHGTR